MNWKYKHILVACLLLAVVLVLTGCAPEQTPYQINDADNYTVSVRYDANGGIFTTNSWILADSYNLSDYQVNAQGQVELALLPPDDARRGNDAFTAINNGYFLAGWYSQRTETTDEQGNTQYVYSGKWDFEEDLLSVDPDGTYTSSEPVMTLYAAWVPLFEIAYYDLDSGEYLSSYTFNPRLVDQLRVPRWNETTGAIEMYDFPKRSGYTFSGAYYDPEGKQAVADTVDHPGVVDEANGVGKDTVLNLYVDWEEGEWYHIYNVEQFLDNASVSGCYVLHADLDFAGEIWPTSLMYGNFSGVIQADGHTMKNIEITQTNNSKVNAGLFGNITDEARITDLNLENVTFTVKSGTRVAGTSYGLFAGTVSANAQVSGVKIQNSVLKIDSACYFGSDDYVIGLVCGMGDPNVVDQADISCESAGNNPEAVKITVDGNEVSVEIVS